LPTLGAIAPQVLGVKLTKAVFTPAASTSHETVAVDEPRRGNGFAAAYWLIAVLAVASAGAWLARPQGTHRR
jgi:hypothetical protein